jgi:hypothetical protein
MSEAPSFPIATALMALVLLVAASADASAGQPAPTPPAGRDPGGVAVALVGAGIDYRHPELAHRLARDGEGTVIGWNMLEGGPLPYDAPPPEGRALPPEAGTAQARLLLAEAPAARLIPVRVPEADARGLAAALAFVRVTPARVVAVLTGPVPETEKALLGRIVEASAHLLVITTANLADAFPQRYANVICVSPLPSLEPARGARGSEPHCDLSVAASGDGGIGTGTEAVNPRAAANAAAVRVAALAARLLHAEPALAAASLRERIAGLATAWPAPAAGAPALRIENIARQPLSR